MSTVRKAALKVPVDFHFIKSFCLKPSAFKNSVFISKASNKMAQFTIVSWPSISFVTGSSLKDYAL